MKQQTWSGMYSNWKLVKVPSLRTSPVTNPCEAGVCALSHAHPPPPPTQKSCQPWRRIFFSTFVTLSVAWTWPPKKTTCNLGSFSSSRNVFCSVGCLNHLSHVVG